MTASKPTSAKRRAAPTHDRSTVAAPPVGDYSATGAELADLLGFSPARVSQLAAVGVIQRGPNNRFNPLQAALALLAYTKRDDAGRQARVRALRARGAAIEMSVHRDLAKLVTLDELRELLDVILDRGADMVRRESQRVYLDCKTRLPEGEAVRCAGAVHRHTLGYIRALDAGGRELVVEMTRDHFQHPGRIAERYAELIDAAMRREVDPEELVDDEDDGEV